MTDRNNVMTGTPRVGGYLFRAPLGTPLPTDASTPLDAAYIDQGYVSEDGVERAVTKAYEAIRDMGGTEVLKTRTEIGVAVTLALLETLNAETAKSVYGEDAVSVTPADGSHGTQVAIAYAGEEVDNSVWVLDLALAGKLKRHVWPNTQLATEDETVTLNSSTADMLPVSLTLYPDESGKYYYTYSDDGVKVGAALPLITAITPSGQSIGDLVTITGARLSGATAVKFDAIDAEFVVASASQIVAVIPVGATGTEPVTVTTAAGTSAPVNYAVVA